MRKNLSPSGSSPVGNRGDGDAEDLIDHGADEATEVQDNARNTHQDQHGNVHIKHPGC